MSIINIDNTPAQDAADFAIGKAFFVPPSSTISVEIGVQVASLEDALAAIQSWIIPSDSLVQILLPAGQTTLTAATSVQHAYGARIQILGQAVVSTSASAVGTVSGSAGAWSLPLTVSSSSGISVNDWVLLRAVSGSGSYRSYAGICKVTAVSGSTVTLLHTAKNSSWPSASLSSATLTVLKSNLSYSGCDGLQIDGPLGLIDRVAIIGNHSSGTVGVIAQRMAEGNKGKAMVRLGSDCGIAAFGDGGIYAQYGGTVDAAEICVADCLIYNLLAQHGGSIFANNAIVSGCADVGVAASTSGDVSFEGGICCGNGGVGLYPFSGGTLLAVNAHVWSNVSDGAVAAYGGVLRANSMESAYNGGNGFVCVGAQMVLRTPTSKYNALAGYYCEGGGSLYANGALADHNSGYGFYADGGAIDAPYDTASSTASSAVSNGASGFSAVNNGTILANQANASGNGAYGISVQSAGMMRATNASVNSVYAVSGGLVDLTGASGTPTTTLGQEGLIITSAGVIQRGSILLGGSASFAIGSTSSAAVNLDKSTSVYQRFAKSGTLKTIVGVDDGGTLIAEAGNGDTVMRAEASLWFSAGGANERGFIDSAGNAALGGAALANNATNGFFYVPQVSGTPTGTPATKSGRVPIQIDTSGSKLWAYIGGAWKSVTLS